MQRKQMTMCRPVSCAGHGTVYDEQPCAQGTQPPPAYQQPLVAHTSPVASLVPRRRRIPASPGSTRGSLVHVVGKHRVAEFSPTSHPVRVQFLGHGGRTTPQHDRGEGVAGGGGPCLAGAVTSADIQGQTPSTLRHSRLARQSGRWFWARHEKPTSSLCHPGGCCRPPRCALIIWFRSTDLGDGTRDRMRNRSATPVLPRPTCAGHTFEHDNSGSDSSSRRAPRHLRPLQTLRALMTSHVHRSWGLNHRVGRKRDLVKASLLQLEALQ